MDSFKFHSDAPILKYCQKLLNRYCFISLESDFDSINQNKSTNAIPLHIDYSLESEVGNCIVFANPFLKRRKK